MNWRRPEKTLGVRIPHLETTRYPFYTEIHRLSGRGVRTRLSGRSVPVAFVGWLLPFRSGCLRGVPVPVDCLPDSSRLPDTSSSVCSPRHGCSRYRVTVGAFRLCDRRPLWCIDCSEWRYVRNCGRPARARWCRHRSGGVRRQSAHRCHERRKQRGDERPCHRVRLLYRVPALHRPASEGTGRVRRWPPDPRVPKDPSLGGPLANRDYRRGNAAGWFLRTARIFLPVSIRFLPPDPCLRSGNFRPHSPSRRAACRRQERPQRARL